ncbi:MAG TPA: hypothetical protein VGC97_21130 [Pyrinomonadaceae bacterium]|jgi:hypothetical protein
MKNLTCCFAFVLILGYSACGQVPVTGNWYGDSVCQVKSSPCKTEKVVYRIILMDDAATKFMMQADKIIDEKPEFMGIIEFQFDAASKTLTGKYRDSVWKFIVSGKEMEGTLTLADGTIYRRIKVAKVLCGGKSYD